MIRPPSPPPLLFAGKASKYYLYTHMLCTYNTAYQYRLAIFFKGGYSDWSKNLGGLVTSFNVTTLLILKSQGIFLCGLGDVIQGHDVTYLKKSQGIFLGTR